MEHQKSYAEYIDEFGSDEIYDGLMRGLFPEKLPPVFTAVMIARRYGLSAATVITSSL